MDAVYDPDYLLLRGLAMGEELGNEAGGDRKVRRGH
jgi:hypothetical protein